MKQVYNAIGLEAGNGNSPLEPVRSVLPGIAHQVATSLGVLN